MFTFFNWERRSLILIGFVYCTAIKVPPLKSILSLGPLFIISENIPDSIRAQDSRIVNLDLLMKLIFESFIICIYILRFFIDFFVIV